MSANWEHIIDAVKRYNRNQVMFHVNYMRMINNNIKQLRSNMSQCQPGIRGYLCRHRINSEIKKLQQNRNKYNEGYKRRFELSVKPHLENYFRGRNAAKKIQSAYRIHRTEKAVNEALEQLVPNVTKKIKVMASVPSLRK